ncbi:hypothetical protein [Flammeovirga sp. SJP92]|uniref:hypothetical protein n=1 Tax=Flammeovirga sp. SJP92 TaxID=1775430 RepID=UPI000786F372|nr:hypothetical protein [Flammeovirga sp. SJP92]KXX71796.1 hypothetical protein AVL50_03150 [Flammeovirga sp. SJP92]
MLDEKIQFSPMIKDCDTFSVTRKVRFSPHLISRGDVLESFEFSYEMAFGKGFHRHYRSGGAVVRKPGEIFANTFQGKLAEFAFYRFLISRNKPCPKPDLTIMGEALWDDADFEIMNRSISIKSACFFSQLLLLEIKDWSSEGIYLPNNKKYDYHFLIRIKGDVKKLLKNKRWLYKNYLNKRDLHGLIFSKQWYSDIPGFVTHQDLVECIKRKQIIYKGSFLNSAKTKIDASNYYIQAGDLRKIK